MAKQLHEACIRGGGARESEAEEAGTVRQSGRGESNEKRG